MMKAKPPQVLYPDHPMYMDATDAMKRYFDERGAGISAEEIERLRQIAEAQIQAVNDYQLRALGCLAGKSHLYALQLRCLGVCTPPVLRRRIPAFISSSFSDLVRPGQFHPQEPP